MKKITSVTIIIILALIITEIYYISVYDNISQNIIRLHIIANSNEQEDIQTKFMVRDEILKSLREKINFSSSKEDIVSNIPEIEKSANEFLTSANIEYSAKIELQNTDIPRKEYDGIVLPNGNYTAIRVILGEGKGENWWCVAYPPLCFTEETSGSLSTTGDKILKNSIDRKSYNMITSDIKYELKIVEIAEDIIGFLKKK